MYGTISLLSKKPGLLLEDFERYYEGRHIPLLLSIVSLPPIYTRRYINRGGSSADNAPALDFEVLTEVVFDTEDDYRRLWLEPLRQGAEARRVAEDEETFLVRASTRTRTFSYAGIQTGGSARAS